MGVKVGKNNDYSGKTPKFFQQIKVNKSHIQMLRPTTLGSFKTNCYIVSAICCLVNASEL